MQAPIRALLGRGETAGEGVSNRLTQLRFALHHRHRQVGAREAVSSVLRRQRRPSRPGAARSELVRAAREKCKKAAAGKLAITAAPFCTRRSRAQTAQHSVCSPRTRCAAALAQNRVLQQRTRTEDSARVRADSFAGWVHPRERNPRKWWPPSHSNLTQLLLESCNRGPAPFILL